jgi:hypothetical protein
MTGDVPAPTKARFAALKDAMDAAEEAILQEHDMKIPLTEREKKVLAFCDLVDLALYASEEVDMGNTAMASVLRNCLGHIKRKDLANISPAAIELYHFLISRTQKHYHPELGEARMAGWTG